MVNNDQQLDQIFSALSDATRRSILAQLSCGELTVAALAEPHAMSAPAISKHLRVLEQAGLVDRSRRGRQHIIRVNPQPVDSAALWIAYYTEIWKQQFLAVDKYLKQTQGKKQ